MIIAKTIYCVQGEKPEETLLKRSKAIKWRASKALDVAEVIDGLKGKAKMKFEEDPDEYILNLLTDEEMEKLIYASMPEKEPFRVDAHIAGFSFIGLVSRYVSASDDK